MRSLLTGRNALNSFVYSSAAPWCDSASGKMETDMELQLHAPSMPVLVISLVLAVLALVFYFVAPATPFGFWLAIMAYVVTALGSAVKT